MLPNIRSPFAVKFERETEPKLSWKTGLLTSIAVLVGLVVINYILWWGDHASNGQIGIALGLAILTAFFIRVRVVARRNKIPFGEYLLHIVYRGRTSW